MVLALQEAFLPCLDADASLAFYCDGIGLTLIHTDATPPRDASRLVLKAHDGHARLILQMLVDDPGLSAGDVQIFLALAAKVSLGRIALVTEDLDGTFERLIHRHAEPLQEPITRADGVRDCGFLDPTGNFVRLLDQSLRPDSA
ncbi:VOC family protein [Gryllotalpicola koreensis]|uniref:VOC family protein n=1 Tax=Gryllotalpicola koreensis TaxID=993086 RepID=A0ABP7ZQH3_9MICO